VIVVSFRAFTPIPRYDGTPWHHVTIQESANQDGPWTLIDTINIIPLDADPSQPAPRSFTTDNATLEEGWYKITFFDSTGNDSLPVTPILNAPEETLPYQPTVEDVANLIIARTKDNLGSELGTFTVNTRPTFESVNNIIDQAADDVTTALDTDIPVEAYDYVKQAIALRAAMIIERSYFAEQINSNRSPYPQLKEDYEWLMGTNEKPGFIIKAVEREAEEEIMGEAALTNRPAYSFPDAELRYKLGRPL
jgi:hypothetical protein